MKIKRNNLTKTYKVIRNQKMQTISPKEDRYLALILDENENIAVTDLGKADELDLLIQNALIASEEGYEDAQNIWDEISNKLFSIIEKIGDLDGTLRLSQRQQHSY